MTPDVPALRAALAASAGEWPWEAVEEIVYGADGQVVAEFAHDDGEPEAVLAALAVNALAVSGMLDRLEKLERVAEAARRRCGALLPGEERRTHDALLAALADLDGGKG